MDKSLGRKAKLDARTFGGKEENISRVFAVKRKKGDRKAGIETAATMSRAGNAPSPCPQPEPIPSHNHNSTSNGLSVPVIHHGPSDSFFVFFPYHSTSDSEPVLERPNVLPISTRWLRVAVLLSSLKLSQLTKHVSRIFDRFYLSRFWIKRSRQEHRQSRPRTVRSHLWVATVPFFSRRNSCTCRKAWASWFAAAQATIRAQWGIWSALPIRTQVTQWLAVRSRRR